MALITSSLLMASGKLAVSMLPRPSSVWMKMGLGAWLAKVDLPMPCVAYRKMRGADWALPRLMELRSNMEN